MSDKKRTGETVPREEYRAACIEVIRLAGFAVNGRSPSPGYAGRIKEILDSGLLFKAAKRHLLTSAVATGLESAGIYDRTFEEEKAKALRKGVLLEHDREEITAEFEKQGIRYTPLKGTVLRYDYPSFGMRQMSDVDILIDPDRAADARKIMESLGFTTTLFDASAHDVYKKPPVSNFELHRELFSERADRRIREYYSDVSRLLIPVAGKNSEYRFSDRDFYVYITAHACKHFSNAGTGLRSLLDAYVFLRAHRDTVDLESAESELDLLGIGDFARVFRKLAFRLFEETGEDDSFSDNLSSEESEMLEYIIDSGVYGTFDHAAEKAIKKRGRLGYLFSVAFLPYRQMCGLYPVLRRAPVLLPFCWIARWVDRIIKKPRRVARYIKSAFRSRRAERR